MHASSSIHSRPQVALAIVHKNHYSIGSSLNLYFPFYLNIVTKKPHKSRARNKKYKKREITYSYWILNVFLETCSVPQTLSRTSLELSDMQLSFRAQAESTLRPSIRLFTHHPNRVHDQSCLREY